MQSLVMAGEMLRPAIHAKARYAKNGPGVLVGQRSGPSGVEVNQRPRNSLTREVMLAASMPALASKPS